MPLKTEVRLAYDCCMILFSKSAPRWTGASSSGCVGGSSRYCVLRYYAVRPADQQQARPVPNRLRTEKPTDTNINASRKQSCRPSQRQHPNKRTQRVSGPGLAAWLSLHRPFFCSSPPCFFTLSLTAPSSHRQTSRGRPSQDSQRALRTRLRPRPSILCLSCQKRTKRSVTSRAHYLGQRTLRPYASPPEPAGEQVAARSLESNQRDQRLASAGHQALEGR